MGFIHMNLYRVSEIFHFQQTKKRIALYVYKELLNMFKTAR